MQDNKTTKDTQEGRKNDDGKPEYDLIPQEILDALAVTLTHGKIKYGANNWKLVKPFKTRYYNALQRHLSDYRNGIRIDEDSGLPHIQLALTNLMFLAWKDMRDEDKVQTKASLDYVMNIINGEPIRVPRYKKSLKEIADEIEPIEEKVDKKIETCDHDWTETNYDSDYGIYTFKCDKCGLIEEE